MPRSQQRTLRAKSEKASVQRVGCAPCAKANLLCRRSAVASAGVARPSALAASPLLQLRGYFPRPLAAVMGVISK
jgi:hypothetical protein